MQDFGSPLALKIPILGPNLRLSGRYQKMKLNCLIVLCEIICCCSEVSDKNEIWRQNGRLLLLLLLLLLLMLLLLLLMLMLMKLLLLQRMSSALKHSSQTSNKWEMVCVRVWAFARVCERVSACVRVCVCACEHSQWFVREKERPRERACACECALKKWDGEREEVISELEVDGSSEIRLWRLSRVSSN